MFISQGPRGSLQAGKKNMLSVFCDIYWIGTTLYLSFFPPFSPDLHLFHFQKCFFFCSPCACMRACVSVCTFLWACCVCLHGIFDPAVTLQAPAHTTSVTVSTTSPQFSAYKFHCCALKDRHVFLSLSPLPLSLSLHSCSHHFTSVRLSFVSRLHTFHRRPSLISTWTKVAWEEVFKTVNSFGISGVEAFYAQLIFHFSFHIYFADKSSNDWRSVSFLSICCCLFPSRVAQCLY